MVLRRPSVQLIADPSEGGVMRRGSRLSISLNALVVVLGLSLCTLVVAPSAIAAPPGGGGMGGGFTNPCNGHDVGFFVPGIQIVQLPGGGGLIVAFVGTGTGVDTVTGVTYRVVFNSTSSFDSVDQGGSHTGNVTIAF